MAGKRGGWGVKGHTTSGQHQWVFSFCCCMMRLFLFLCVGFSDSTPSLHCLGLGRPRGMDFVAQLLFGVRMELEAEGKNENEELQHG